MYDVLGEDNRHTRAALYSLVMTYRDADDHGMAPKLEKQIYEKIRDILDGTPSFTLNTSKFWPLTVAEP